MWREFSPLRSKNSLFSPTEERRRMPFGLPAGNGFPLLLLFRKRARSARLLGPKRPRDGSLSLPPFCGCLRPKLTASAKNPATVRRGGIFPQGALPPMWREFSPRCSKNSLFSPTGERRQMPFGLPTRDRIPFISQPGPFLCLRFLPASKPDLN